MISVLVSVHAARGGSWPQSSKSQVIHPFNVDRNVFKVVVDHSQVFPVGCLGAEALTADLAWGLRRSIVLLPHQITIWLSGHPLLSLEDLHSIQSRKEEARG